MGAGIQAGVALTPGRRPWGHGRALRRVANSENVGDQKEQRSRWPGTVDQRLVGRQRPGEAGARAGGTGWAGDGRGPLRAGGGRRGLKSERARL